MADKVEQRSEQHFHSPLVSVEDVNRILEVGNMLLSVLTPEEQIEIQELLKMSFSEPFPQERASVRGIGNTSVT